MDDACDFYDALRRSTFEENIYGTYFRNYKRLIRHKFYINMTRKRVLVDRRILEQIPLLIIGYFIENKLSDRVITENKQNGGIMPTPYRDDEEDLEYFGEDENPEDDYSDFEDEDDLDYEDDDDYIDELDEEYE